MLKESRLLQFTRVCMQLATQRVPLYSPPSPHIPSPSPSQRLLAERRGDRRFGCQALLTNGSSLRLELGSPRSLVGTGTQTVLDGHVTSSPKHDTQMAPGGSDD